MNITGVELDQKIIETLNSVEKFRIILNSKSVIIDNDNIIFPTDSNIIINNKNIFARGLISKIYHDEGSDSLILVDQYNYNIMQLDMHNKMITINELRNDLYNIELKDDHINYNNDIEYPIYSMEVKDKFNNIYTGSLYVEFSPYTKYKRYLLATYIGNINYITSSFNVIIEDCKNSTFFNLLGVFPNDIKVLKINTRTDKFIGEYTFNFNNISDSNFYLKDSDGKFEEVSYFNLIYPSRYDFKYVLINNDYICYNKLEDKASKELNIKQLSILRELSESEINKYKNALDAMETFIINKPKISKVDRKNLKNILKDYKYIYEEFSSVIENSSGLLFIDEYNTIFTVSDIKNFKTKLEVFESILK